MDASPVSEWLSLSWLSRELYPASFRNRVGNHFQLLAKEPNRPEMPSGCYLYCIRSGVGRLCYKAHIRAASTSRKRNKVDDHEEDADPDIPILKEAKAEYVKLN
jgi:hypothetical protein